MSKQPRINKHRLAFKSQWSKYRYIISGFNARIESSNLPCGQDDRLCELFLDYLNDWVKENHTIKKVVELNDVLDGAKFYNPKTLIFYQNQWKLNHD